MKRGLRFCLAAGLCGAGLTLSAVVPLDSAEQAAPAQVEQVVLIGGGPAACTAALYAARVDSEQGLVMQAPLGNWPLLIVLLDGSGRPEPTQAGTDVR
jgi:hypothetical protein